MRRAPLLILLALAQPAAAQQRPPRGVHLIPQNRATAVSAPAKPAPVTPAGRLTLTGLPVHADASAVCRATCARGRFTCEAADEDCGMRWSACLRPCGAAPRQ